MRAASCDNESLVFSNASTMRSPLTKASTTQSQRIPALRNNPICVEVSASCVTRGRSGCQPPRLRAVVERSWQGAEAASALGQGWLVGAGRFELPTPGPPDRCANRAALRSDVWSGYTPWRTETSRSAVGQDLGVSARKLPLDAGEDAAAGLEFVQQRGERVAIELRLPLSPDAYRACGRGFARLPRRHRGFPARRGAAPTSPLERAAAVP